MYAHAAPYRRPSALVALAALVLTLLLGLPTPAQAAVTFPGDFRVTEVTSALRAPHAMKFAPDGRLFVLEQRGFVRIVRNGALLPTPALTLTVLTGGSRGLLGLAFDPSFATNGHLYLFYTAGTPAAHNRVSRFTVSGDTINPASEVVLADLDPLGNSTMHYGGDMGFGPDGRLYVTVGDNLRGPNAQELGNRFGKLLRYNPDGSIPTDNPFYNQASGPNRAIWALGLRNPYRLIFHPTTGQMLIGDVGSAAWEEVNVGRAGANYGWPNAEGNSGNPAYTNPLLAYPHVDDGTGVFGCAVMGGDFYAPATRTFPASFWNRYFFADHCEGWLRVLDPSNGSSVPFGSGFERPVDFKVGPDGNLYTLQRELNGVARGVLYRVSFAGGANQPPQIGAQPQDVTVGIGGSASFSVVASGTPPLGYQWRRNGANIPGATGTSYTLTNAQAADNGARFSVVVTNQYGSVTSREALLTVRNDQPPSASITSPAQGATYAGGQQLTITGTASDPEDGTPPPEAFEWEVVFHHNTHTHPFIEPFGGTRSFTATIPTDDETDTDVFYRIHLRVTDSVGNTTEVTRDVLPRTSSANLQSVPWAWQLTLDGSPVTTPTSFSGVVGVRRTLGAPPRTVNNLAWVLDCWEDYSTATERPILMASTARTYQALYRRNAGSIGTGTGLSGTYFATNNFTQPVVTRVDRAMFATWPGSPAPGVPANGFSVRWTGQLQGQFSGTHTLFMVANDRARVWLGGTRIFDTFGAPTTAEQRATVSLQAGQRYPITIELADDAGSAKFTLKWSGPSLPKSVVPGTQLYPS
ncbi:MAG TPA: PQQ-dependent sugar dehydrogenase [Actinomycetota bacterium]|nr:PQQ-dependent sugar dehydrogenase [Actinomycetota bacterium]